MPDAKPAPQPGQAGPPAGPAPAALALAQDHFISAWGKMGSSWGISRTMAEVHALLYITGDDLCTDEIMDRLQISRGNASMSIRSLLDWGIVVRVHRRGDRKEYYRAEQDVWALFRAIVRERIKREVDPLLASLYEIRDLTASAPRAPRAKKPDDPVSAHLRRLDTMLEFLETVEKLGQRFASPSGAGLEVAARMLRRVS